MWDIWYEAIVFSVLEKDNREREGGNDKARQGRGVHCMKCIPRGCWNQMCYNFNYFYHKTHVVKK